MFYRRSKKITKFGLTAHFNVIWTRQGDSPIFLPQDHPIGSRLCYFLARNCRGILSIYFGGICIEVGGSSPVYRHLLLQILLFGEVQNIGPRTYIV